MGGGWLLAGRALQNPLVFRVGVITGNVPCKVGGVITVTQDLAQSLSRHSEQAACVVLAQSATLPLSRPGPW